MIRKVLPLMMVMCLLAAAFATAALAGVDKPVKEKPTPKVIRQVRVAKGAASDAADRMRVLRTTDKAQITTYVPMVFETKYVNPYVIHQKLKETIQTEAGLIGTYMSTAEGAEGGLVIVVVPEYQLEQIGKFIEQLDIPGLTDSTGTDWKYINLRNRSVLENYVQPALLQWAGADTRIMDDPDTNSIFVVGAKSGVDAVLAAVAEYDIPTTQISVAVKIFEVDSANDGTLGLDFHAWKNGPGQSLFAVGASGYHVHTQRVSARMRGYTSSYSVEYPSEFFDFLTVKGSARILNESKVSVLNTITAQFRAVDQILYYAVTADNVSTREVNGSLVDRAGEVASYLTPGAVADRAWERGNNFGYPADVYPNIAPRPNQPMIAEAGVILTVTPTISMNDIDMDVQTTINSFTGFEDSGMPMIASRVVDTRIRAADGQETVLGRMNRVRTVKTTRKIPILGSIPGLGFLFGGEVSAQKVTMVVEVITPTIIEQGGLSDADKTVIGQVSGAPAPLPADEYGFEQMGIDE